MRRLTEGACIGWEVEEIDMEAYTGAVQVRDTVDGTLRRFGRLEAGQEGGTCWLIGDDWSVLCLGKDEAGDKRSKEE